MQKRDSSVLFFFVCSITVLLIFCPPVLAPWDINLLHLFHSKQAGSINHEKSSCSLVYPHLCLCSYTSLVPSSLTCSLLPKWNTKSCILLDLSWFLFRDDLHGHSSRGKGWTLLPSPGSPQTWISSVWQGILGPNALSQEIWNKIPHVPISLHWSATKIIYSWMRLSSDYSFPFCLKPSQTQRKSLGSLKENIAK
jgi:hypothetical protein